jgi:Tol biopolymer transport system component
MQKRKKIIVLSVFVLVFLIALMSSEQMNALAEGAHDNVMVSNSKIANDPQLTKIADYEINKTAPTAVGSDISSDGKFIVFASNSGDASKPSSLLSISYSNSSTRTGEPFSNATLHQLPLTLTFSGIFNPRISPDNTKVLFIGIWTNSSNVTEQGLFEYDLEKNAPSRIPLNVSNIRSADWMPDGTILYIEGRSTLKGDSVWIAERNGSGSRLIYNNSSDLIEDIDVSSDGTRIAYVTSKPNDVYGLYLKILDLRNGKTREIKNVSDETNPILPALHQPRWVLNDKFIVATYAPKGSASQIRLLSDEGKMNIPLYNDSAANAAGAAVTNDGKTLIFSLSPSGKESHIASGIYELQFDKPIPEFPMVAATIIVTALILSPVLFLTRVYRMNIR